MDNLETDVPLSPFRFWQQAYISAIRSGLPGTAQKIAQQALNDYQKLRQDNRQKGLLSEDT